MAKTWAEAGKLAGGGIVATIMSNLGLERFLESHKLKLHRTKVGDRYVVEHMREHGFNVGGEQSGHIVLSDFATTGDGLVAALQVLAAVQSSGRPVSQVCRLFTPLPQISKSVRIASAAPLELPQVKEAIADVKRDLGTGGRVVVRPSGTEPLIRVMAEGDDEAAVRRAVDQICTVLEKAAA